MKSTCCCRPNNGLVGKICPCWTIGWGEEMAGWLGRPKGFIRWLRMSRCGECLCSCWGGLWWPIGTGALTLWPIGLEADPNPGGGATDLWSISGLVCPEFGFTSKLLSSSSRVIAWLMDGRGGGLSLPRSMGIEPGMSVGLPSSVVSNPIPANRDMKWGSGSEIKRQERELVSNNLFSVFNEYYHKQRI